MADQARQLVARGAPWRRGVPWWLVALQGAVVAAIGLYLLVAPSSAQTAIRQLLAGVLLVLSGVLAYGAFRDAVDPTTPYHALRGGIGLTAGSIVLLEPLATYLEPPAARVILAFGWLAYGVLGLVTTLVFRDDRGLRLGGLITGALAVALAVVLLSSGNGAGADRVALLGWIALIGGALLLAYAAFLNRTAGHGAVASGAPA